VVAKRNELMLDLANVAFPVGADGTVIRLDFAGAAVPTYPNQEVFRESR